MFWWFLRNFSIASSLGIHKITAVALDLRVFFLWRLAINIASILNIFEYTDLQQKWKSNASELQLEFSSATFLPLSYICWAVDCRGWWSSNRPTGCPVAIVVGRHQGVHVGTAQQILPTPQRLASSSGENWGVNQPPFQENFTFLA